MSSPTHTRRSAPLLAGLVATVLTILFLAATGSPTQGDDHPWGSIFHKHFGHEHVPPGQIETLNGGAWYWMRSPEQEKTVVDELVQPVLHPLSRCGWPGRLGYPGHP